MSHLCDHLEASTTSPTHVNPAYTPVHLAWEKAAAKNPAMDTKERMIQDTRRRAYAALVRDVG